MWNSWWRNREIKNGVWTREGIRDGDAVGGEEEGVGVTELEDRVVVTEEKGV